MGQQLGSAGTVMFQEARRIRDLHHRSGSFTELATLQCQSYLAAINALSLVEPAHAWIAVIATDNPTERVRRVICIPPPSCPAHIQSRGQVSKRRRIVYQIPNDEFEDTASPPSDIVELADIRREYTIALARLQLAVEFPELERTSQ